MTAVIIMLLFFYLSELISAGTGEVFAVGVIDRREGEVLVMLLEEREEEVEIRAGDSIGPGQWYLVSLQDDKNSLLIKRLVHLEEKHREKSKELREELRKKSSSSEQCSNCTSIFTPFKEVNLLY